MVFIIKSILSIYLLYNNNKTGIGDCDEPPEYKAQLSEAQPHSYISFVGEIKEAMAWPDAIHLP